MSPKTLIFVAPLLIAVSLTAWAGEFKVIGVHVGDTIRARGGDSEIEVRLSGIHALEILSEGIKKGQAYRGMIASLAYRVSCFDQENLSDGIDASDKQSPRMQAVSTLQGIFVSITREIWKVR